MVPEYSQLQYVLMSEAVWVGPMSSVSGSERSEAHSCFSTRLKYSEERTRTAWWILRVVVEGGGPAFMVMILLERLVECISLGVDKCGRCLSGSCSMKVS